MKKNSKSILAVLSSFMLAVAMYSTALGASASEDTTSTDTISDASISSLADASSIVVEEGTEGYIKIICEDNGKALENVNWRIYYIGIREENEIKFDDKFTDVADLNLESATDKDMKDIADKIGKQITAKSIAPDYTFKTNSLGIIEQKLPYGIYYLEMDEFEKDGKKYKSAPAVTEINNWEEIDEVYPKMSTESTPDSSSSSSSSSSSTTSTPTTSTPNNDTPPSTGSVAIGGAAMIAFAAALGLVKGKDDKEN